MLWLGIQNDLRLLRWRLWRGLYLVLMRAALQAQRRAARLDRRGM